MTTNTNPGPETLNGVLSRLVPGGLFVLILFLGGALRFIAVEETVVIAPIRADAADYFHYAYNLKYHRSYSRTPPTMNGDVAPTPDAVRSPGYPLFIAPFLSDPPTYANLHQIQLIQALLSTLVIALVFALARLVLSPVLALLPALLTAVSPHLINTNLYLLTESLFTFLLYAALLAGAYAGRQRGRWLLIGCGLLIGLGTLVRPTLLFLPLVLALLYVADGERGAGEALRRSGWLVLGFVIAYGSWPLRNQIVLADGASKQLQVNFLHHGMYPDFRYRDDPVSTGYPYRFDSESPRIAHDLGSVTAEIVRRFREEPQRHLTWYLLGKPTTYWSWNIVQGMGDSFIYPVNQTPYATRNLFQTTHRIMRQLHVPLVLLAAAGALLAWLPIGSKQTTEPRRQSARLASIVALYFTLFHMIGAPFPRYAIPVYPLVYVLAVLAVSHAIGRLADHSKAGKSLSQG